jgi:transposase InsO family protein
MDQDNKTKVALFRFSLIAPIVNNTFAEDSAKDYLESICARKYDVPGFGQKEYSPATLKDWLSLYRKHGFDGLLPKKRTDAGDSRCLTKEHKDIIIALKHENSRYSAQHIYDSLIAKGTIVAEKVSLSSVTRFIKKNNLKTQQLQPVDRRAFEMEFPNDCWQADTSVGPYLTIDGKKKKTYIILFLDDCSRVIVHAEIFFEENLINLEKVLKKAVAKRGIPKKLFVDNGAVYQSDQLQMVCASLGTVVSYAKIYTPQSKGKVERVFRSIKDRWMHILDWNKISSLEELNSLFTDFVENDYNHHKHSSIDMKPIDKFMQHIDSIRFVKSTEELNRIFLHRASRKVINDATISLNTTIFEVPAKYIGEKILVRYEAFSMAKAYIFNDRGTQLETIFPVRKVDNSKVKRASTMDYPSLQNKEMNSNV